MNNFFKLLPAMGLLALVGTVNSTFGACLGTGSECSETVTVEVEILPGDICIGTTGSFDFGTYTVSSSVQTVNGSFTDYFWVDDLKGLDSGYYTTLQLDGDLVGPGGATIPASAVFAQVASTNATLLSGGANPRVEVANGLTSWSALNSAQTFIKRDPATNDGIVGKYGSLPDLRVDIPAYQAVGTYTATLTYTLYEN